MKRSVIAGCLTLLFISMVSTGYARFLVTPSVSVREMYNDNIFLSEDDEEDDFITTISPNIDLKYSPNTKLDMSLNYGLNFRIYADHNELNDTDLREVQSVRFNADARPFNRVYLKVTDTYDRVAIDQRRATAEDNAYVNRTDRNVFAISPYVILPVTPSSSFTAGYEYINTWYRDSDATDSESHSLFGSLDKKFTPKVTGFLKYRFTNYRADTADTAAGVDDYDKHDGTVGVSYRLNARTELSGEAGQSYLNSGELDDSEAFIWKVRAAYNEAIESAWSAVATYGRSFENSITNGATERENADLIVTFGRAYKIIVNPYYRVDKFINVDREDRVAGISTTISRNLSDKTTMSVNGSFEHQEFLPQSEEVEQYSAGANLSYRIRKNTTMGIGYRFNRRDSDISSGDFDNNIAWIQGTVEF